MNEAKLYVLEGLEQRKADWRTREQQLDSYEEEMITRCNQHCADRKTERNRKEIQEIFSAQRRAQQQEQQRIEMETSWAVRKYLLFCLGTMMVATWSPMEWWAALALMAGVAVFPAVYIFRLHYPLEEAK